MSSDTEQEATSTPFAKPSAPTQKLGTLQRFASLVKPKEKGTLSFPPQSWTQEGKELGGIPGSETVPADISPEHAPVRATEEDIAEAPEPATLARRIQGLLASASSHATNSQLSSSIENHASALDQKLKAWLSSETVMSGAVVKGSQSVWACLDRLKQGGSSPHASQEKDDKGHEDREEQTGDDAEDDEDSSIMMYAPLVPDDSSEVEVAEREPVDEEKSHDREKPTFPKREGPSERRKGTEKRVWVPSPTKMSLETSWWGYRLYLPPPVLATLNAYQPVAAKKAAVISTSLKYMLDKVPIALVPAQYRASLILLKRLAPYLGSIGVFIAWSWSHISVHDKGHGVILTATWLLPVALVPSTWDPKKFPKSASAKNSGVGTPSPDIKSHKESGVENTTSDGRKPST